MDDQKQQIIDKLKGAKNVLITVSMNPSVDQLAACIALTLLLNKLDKHATAVYSGETPSTIEFLQPEATIEKNTDSLRDFIISLDKSKADKLRYKVEEKVVKIFITPYKTSLSGDDLEFSQGDFNVDVVVGLGIHRQQDIDSAITTHGRILHDATIVTINNTPDAEIGSLHWQDLSASSLSELISNLARDLGDNVLDGQIATALLTGIVAETQRFRNNKTTPRTMSISAELMAAGANQQLVADQLDKPSAGGAPLDASGSDGAAVAATPTDDAGTLEITHPDEASAPDGGEAPADVAEPPIVAPAPIVDLPAPKIDQEIDSEVDDDLPRITGVRGNGETSELSSHDSPKMMTEAPTMGGVLTANSRPEVLDPATDPLSTQSINDTPILSRDNPKTVPNDVPSVQPPAFVPSVNTAQLLDSFEPTMMPEVTKSDPHIYDNETLSELEQTVHHDEPVPSTDEVPKVGQAEAVIDIAASGLDSARQAVENAIKAAGDAPARPDAPLEPVSNLGWQGQLDVQPLAPVPAPVPMPLPMPAPSPIVIEPPQPMPVDPNLPTLGPKTQLSVDEPAPLGGSPADQPLTMPLPPSINVPPANPVPPTSPSGNGPQAPPPVPPPMLPNQPL